MKIKLFSYPPNTVLLASICTPRTSEGVYRLYFVYPQKAWKTTLGMNSAWKECYDRQIAVDLLVRSDAYPPKRDGSSVYVPNASEAKMFLLVAIPVDIELEGAKQLINRLIHCAETVWELAEDGS